MPRSRRAGVNPALLLLKFLKQDFSRGISHYLAVAQASLPRLTAHMFSQNLFVGFIGIGFETDGIFRIIAADKAMVSPLFSPENETWRQDCHRAAQSGFVYCWVRLS